MPNMSERKILRGRHVTLKMVGKSTVLESVEDVHMGLVGACY